MKCEISFCNKEGKRHYNVGFGELILCDEHWKKFKNGLAESDMSDWDNDVNDGACWFCSKKTDEKTNEMLFSMEFDCYYHIKCLYKEFKEGSPSQEALIMYQELKRNIVHLHIEHAIKELLDIGEEIIDGDSDNVKKIED